MSSKCIKHTKQANQHHKKTQKHVPNMLQENQVRTLRTCQPASPFFNCSTKYEIWTWSFPCKNMLVQDQHTNPIQSPSIHGEMKDLYLCLIHLVAEDLMPQAVLRFLYHYKQNTTETSSCSPPSAARGTVAVSLFPDAEQNRTAWVLFLSWQKNKNWLHSLKTTMKHLENVDSPDLKEPSMHQSFARTQKFHFYFFTILPTFQPTRFWPTTDTQHHRTTPSASLPPDPRAWADPRSRGQPGMRGCGEVQQ